MNTKEFIALRKACRLTQAELAILVGRGTRTINRIEARPWNAKIDKALAAAAHAQLARLAALERA